MPNNTSSNASSLRLSGRRSIVTWVDILGFGSMLEKKQYNKAHSARIQLQRFSSNQDSIYGDPSIATFAVSDAIIRVADAHKEQAVGSLFFELSNMCINQLNVVLNGVPVSGAITIGEVCLGPSDNQAPMGTAVGVAYDLDEAKWQPAIQLDDNLIELFLETPEMFYNAPKDEFDYTFPMIFSADEKYFLNYLSAACEDEGELLDCLLKHKEFIESKLIEFEQVVGVHRKYSFLRDYHNAFIDWLCDEDQSSLVACGLAFHPDGTDAENALNNCRIVALTEPTEIAFYSKSDTEFMIYSSD